MINLSTEQLLTLVEAASLRSANRRGRPTHVSTVYRWISSGVRGVRLEALRLGGQLYTSKEALQRFADDLTRPQDKLSPFPTSCGAKSRRLAEERANRKLDQARI